MKNMAILLGTLIGISFLLSCSKKNEESETPPFFDEGLADGINYGIAANYTNDIDIASNEYVLSADDFENGMVNIYTEGDRYKNNVDVNASAANQSKYGALHTWSKGEDGPTCRYPIPNEAHTHERQTYFVRMYLNYDDSFHPGDGMEGVGVKGFGIYNEQGPSGINTPCDGTNWYAASCQFVGWGPSQKPEANNGYLWFGHLYSYCPEADKAIAEQGTIKLNNPGSGNSPYRFSIYADPYLYIKFNQWYCYEIGLYLNTPGQSDGEIRFWIDGVLQSRATNMRFRNIEDLKPQYVHLNLHRTTPNFPQVMKRFADNIVISTRYIGPIPAN